MSRPAPAARTGASIGGRFAGLVVAMMLAACASKPPEVQRSPRVEPVPSSAHSPESAPAPPPPATGAAPLRDGPDAQPPPDLERVPDAEPTLEPIRNGGPNKPYEAAGQSFVPLTQDAPFSERGLASWYGRKFHGRRTASGELYNMYAMTAAHKTLPIPSYARVRNPTNGAEVLVRVNDRGPFVRGRIIDLSYTAALKLGLLRGVGTVEIERITLDDIRTGAWRRDPGTAVASASASASASAPVPPALPDATLAATATTTTTTSGLSTTTLQPATAPAATPVSAPPANATPVVADASPISASPPATPSAPGSEPADPALRAIAPPSRGFWVQLGAFKERRGAEEFHRRVSTSHDWLAPMLAVFIDLPLFRLQAGPYPSRDEARGVAEQIRSALQLVPLILERR